ncbi:hypothetical protein H6G57_06710 [Planktothrix sp. FACHB-1365]|nr:hypothetical protein [Planktothrix sp. FACHB-1365]
MSLYCSTTNGLLIDATVAITLHFLTVSENRKPAAFLGNSHRIAGWELGLWYSIFRSLPQLSVN